MTGFYELITSQYEENQFDIVSVEVRDARGISIIGIDEPVTEEVDFLRSAVNALNREEAIKRATQKASPIHEDEPDTDDRDRYEHEMREIGNGGYWGQDR